MLDFTKLWDTTYLFGPNPLELTRSDYIFFGIGAAFFVLGIVLKIIALRNDRRSPMRYLYNRFFHLFFTMGLFVLVWVGIRFENIPWFSARIVVLLILLGWCVWFAFIIKYWRKEYQTQQRVWDEHQMRSKYLP